MDDERTTVAIITLASGRHIELEGYSLKDATSSLSEALRARVPWTVRDRGTYIVAINPFAVETIGVRAA